MIPEAHATSSTGAPAARWSDLVAVQLHVLGLQVGRDGVAPRDELHIHIKRHEVSVADLEAIILEKDAIIAQRDASIVQRDALCSQRDVVTEEMMEWLRTHAGEEEERSTHHIGSGLAVNVRHPQTATEDGFSLPPAQRGPEAQNERGPQGCINRAPPPPLPSANVLAQSIRRKALLEACSPMLPALSVTIMG